MTENKITAASYIIEYYNTVRSLNETASIYLNIMLELTNKYGNELNDIEPEAKVVMQQQIQSFRHWANKVIFMYEAIFNLKGFKKDKKVTELYNYISTNFGLDPKKVKEFTVAINASLISNIFQDILQDSKQIVENIYTHAK